jgi:hypothetical protein
MALFPMQVRQDSKYFKVNQEDVTIVGSMEGGYDVTRPRTTRVPRLTLTTGFTDISAAEMAVLETFYKLVGKYGSVEYTHPVTLVELVVRIVEWPEQSYVGVGGAHFYDFAQIKFKEV